MKLTENINIGPGQPVDPEHILRSLKALSGDINDIDIIIKGSFTNYGNFTNAGSASIYGDLTLNNSSFFIGNKFVIKKNGNINGTKAYFDLVNSDNIIVSSSLIIKNIPSQETTTLLSIDLNTGVVGYASGSLKQSNDGKWFDKNFEFNTEVRRTECITTFKNKIYNLSLVNSDEIKEVKIFSKINQSTLSWIEHKDLISLENWIDKEYDEKSLFWLKMEAQYTDFCSGRAESILTYSITK